MILGLDHVALSVRDLNRSLAFYRDFLGMELVMDLDVRDDRIERIIGQPGARCRLVHLRLGPTTLELFQYSHPVGSDRARHLRQFDRGLTHIGFRVTQFDRLIAQLKEKGIPLLGEPIEFRPGVRVVYFQGPDGEVCEFRQIEPN